MWEKRFPYQTTLFLSVWLILLLTGSGAWAAIQGKKLASMVVPDQGILPGSRITEVMRLDIVETDTSTPDNPQDDGAATLESLIVSFSKLKNTDLSELSTVSLYRIGQSIDEDGFDFQRDFRFANNLLLRRQPIDSVVVVFDEINETIENTTAIFFVAITTDVTLDSNDEFALTVGNIVVTHPESVDPNPNLKRDSEILTCVDFAGDLMPMADYIRGDGYERDYPFSPHNYKDFSYQHPDALNDLFDLEIPMVLPAESTPTAVLGIEMAGVRSELEAIRLNFTSSINGVNNDNDYFIDEDLFPYSVRGAFDPFIDEIVRDVDGDGFFSDEDIVLYPGYNGIIDAERKDFDDDGDGLIDEESRNLFRRYDQYGNLISGAFDLYEVNEDRDFYVEDQPSPDGRFNPGQDEVYKDYDGDGRYAGPGDLDVLLFSTTGALAQGTPLTFFPSDTEIAFVDRNANNRFDADTEILMRDIDGSGKVANTPDITIDLDGAITSDRGSTFFREIEIGGLGLPFAVDDHVMTNNLQGREPLVVFRDNPPFNEIPDDYDQLLIAPTGFGSATNTMTYVNVVSATEYTWYYHDRDFDEEFEGGEDIYINVLPDQPEYLDESESTTVLYIPVGVAVPSNGETQISASREFLLTFYDVNSNWVYDEDEAIVLESFFSLSPTYTTQSEGVSEGIENGYSLNSGDEYLSVAEPLIDEDHGYTFCNPWSMKIYRTGLLGTTMMAFPASVFETWMAMEIISPLMRI